MAYCPLGMWSNTFVFGRLPGLRKLRSGAEIQADDKMVFDVTAFEAKPGRRKFPSRSKMSGPLRKMMGHNFVLLDRTITTGNVQTSSTSPRTRRGMIMFHPGPGMCWHTLNYLGLTKQKS